VRLAQTLVPSLPYFNYFDSARFAAAARTVLNKCDVLYERYGFMGYGGALLSRSLGIPLLLEVDGHPFEELDRAGHQLPPVQDWVSRRVARWTFHNATCVLPSGFGWEQALVQTGLLDPQRSHVVWPAAEITGRPDRGAIEQLRSEWQLGPGPVVTFIGCFEAWQGLAGLVRAFAQVAQEIPVAVLVLAGEGTLESEVRASIRQSGCEARVRLVGYQPAEPLAVLLALTDVGVQLYEGRAEFVGMKLFDYMAAGIAVIVTATAKLHDLVKDEETGLVIEPGNNDELVAALLRLLGDPGLRKRLGRRAQDQVQGGHTWDRRATEIERLAHSFLAQSPGASTKLRWRSDEHPGLA